MSFETGKRYAVFSIKDVAGTNGAGDQKVWTRAGSAWVNRDGSINVYLDVLPLDGKLHIRADSKQQAEAPR